MQCYVGGFGADVSDGFIKILICVYCCAIIGFVIPDVEGDFRGFMFSGDY